MDDHWSRPTNTARARLLAVGLVAVVLGLCLAYDHWRADLPRWWRAHGGGIPYVMFWIVGWFVVLPYRRAIVPISAACVATTCLLEFLQLWRPPWLVAFRSTRLGAAWLGNGFTWHDLPPYVIGGLVGASLLLLIHRLASRR